MDRTNFNMIVVSENENKGIANINDELAELVRTNGYAYVKVDADRDWVNWQFVGSLRWWERGKAPQDFIAVRDFLVRKGFEMTLTYWGARHFQKA